MTKKRQEEQQEEEIVLLQANKDRFIDLAQAALEEVDFEEEQKGVIQEVVEAFISKTGAPLVAEAISEQLHSQDVIERLAEFHQEKKFQLSRIDSTDSIHSIKSPDDEELEGQSEVIKLHSQAFFLFAEYIWRFFRILILSSLVGLVWHFLK